MERCLSNLSLKINDDDDGDDDGDDDDDDAEVSERFENKRIDCLDCGSNFKHISLHLA
jgi:hypothetical protein